MMANSLTSTGATMKTNLLLQKREALGMIGGS